MNSSHLWPHPAACRCKLVVNWMDGESGWGLRGRTERGHPGITGLQPYGLEFSSAFFKRWDYAAVLLKPFNCKWIDFWKVSTPTEGDSRGHVDRTNMDDWTEVSLPLRLKLITLVSVRHRSPSVLMQNKRNKYWNSSTFWEICLFASLTRVRWERWYHFHVCTVYIKIQPAAS